MSRGQGRHKGTNHAHEAAHPRDARGRTVSLLTPKLSRDLCHDAEFSYLFDFHIAVKNKLRPLKLKQWLLRGRNSDDQPYASFAMNWDRARARMVQKLYTEIVDQGFGKKKIKSKYPGNADFLIKFINNRFPQFDGKPMNTMLSFDNIGYEETISKESKAESALNSPQFQAWLKEHGYEKRSDTLLPEDIKKILDT